jgi:Family of unknown function (DUF5372)
MADTRRRFRVVHPFHPLHGREFEIVEHRLIFSRSVLYFQAEGDYLAQIPAVWTDFTTGDPFLEIAAGHSPLHGASLLQLTDLVATLRKSSPERCQ